jgi:SAM-dependent methyltransferase
MVDKPASLLMAHSDLFTSETGPVLDLACGKGQNGLFLAKKGLSITLCDSSAEALNHAKDAAEQADLKVKIWRVDLENEGINPLDENAYGAILVFRYLHRPLIPCIKKALMEDGILIYETFTIGQVKYGRPSNPEYLLKRGELKRWFQKWNIMHYLEGILENPQRAVAQIVCRKPVT